MVGYLDEAFSQLKLVEDDFNFSSVDKDKLDRLQDFVSDDVEEEEVHDEEVYDASANSEDDLEASYDGMIILQCKNELCNAKIIKPKEEVIIDDETDSANVDEECPICGGKFGFVIKGKIEDVDEHDFSTEDEDDEDEESSDEDFEDEESKEVVDDDEDEEDNKKVHESLAVRVTRKHLTEAMVKRSSSQAVADLLRANGININEEADGVDVDEALGKSDVSALVADEKEAITGYNRALKKGPSKKAADQLSEIRDDEKEHIKELKDIDIDESMLNEAPEGYDYERVSTPASRWQDIEDWRTPDVIEDAVNNYARMMTGVLRNSDYTHQRLVRLYEAIETVADKFKTTYEDIGAWILEHRYSIPMEDCADTWCVDSSCYILSADDAACIRITEDSADIIENNFGFMNTTNGVMIDRSTAANMIAESFESWREFISWLEDTVKLLPGAVNRLFKSAYANLDSYIDAHEGIRESIDFHASQENEVNVSKADDGSLNINVANAGDAGMAALNAEGPVMAPLSDEDMADIENNGEDTFEEPDDDFEEPIPDEDEFTFGDEEEETSEDSEEAPEEEEEGANESFSYFDEGRFTKIVESFLHKTYNNVKSYEVKSITENASSVVVEGVLNFRSGKSAPTKFVFNDAYETKDGRVMLEGYNKYFANKTSFKLKGKLDESKNFLSEKFIYKFKTGFINESTGKNLVVSGKIKL